MTHDWLVLFMSIATIGLATHIARAQAHLQYHWRAGRFRPYAGGGLRFAYVGIRLHRQQDKSRLAAAR
jgi:hypothetical protein